MTHDQIPKFATWLQRGMLTSGGMNVGTFSELGWTPPEESMPEKHWLAALLSVTRAQNTSMWQLGDLWAFGDRTYGSRKAITEAPGWHGPAFQTCANAALVARRFTTSRRREVLSFSHHQEVLALPDDIADQMLDWAEVGKKSMRELREHVQAYKRDPAAANADVMLNKVERYLHGLQAVENTKAKLRRVAKIAPDLAQQVINGKLKINTALTVARDRHAARAEELRISREQAAAEFTTPVRSTSSTIVVPLRNTAEEERQHILETARKLSELASQLRAITAANVSAESLLKRFTTAEANEIEASLRTGVRFVKHILDNWSVLRKGEYHHEQHDTSSTNR